MKYERLYRFLRPVVLPAIAGAAVSTMGIAQGQRPDTRRGERAEARQQQRDDRQEQRAGQNSSKMLSQHAEDEEPALGVIVGSCPGEGVCVKDTVWNSPADSAGIRQGDYILSVDGKKVSSPGELRELIKKMKPGQETSVTVWREGEEMKKELMLASRAEQQPESHKAWLGVMLARTDGEGVRVEQVVPRSPADEAGLQRGDTIVKQGGQEVTDVQAFVRSVEDKGPGTDLQLTVRRDGEEQQLDVTLGHVHAAPMRFLRAMRPPMDGPQGGFGGGFGPGPGFGGGGDPMMEETLDQIRRQLHQLEQEVRRLQQHHQDSDAPSDPDVSLRFDAAEQNGTTLVVQRGDFWDRNRWDRGNRWNRGNRYYNDRGWNDGYGYRSYRPLYRSPRYGNYYYNYGGRPYYNRGGGYGYGYGRSGIQLGNFGVYWY